MSYKLNKIIFQRDHSWGYEKYIYNLSVEIDFPYVAGEYNTIIPKDSSIIKHYKPEISDIPLFGANGLAKLFPEVGPKGIFYLELRPNFKIKQLTIEPEDVLADINTGLKDTLIYSFYNPTRRNTISINIVIEKDTQVFNKLKSNRSDIYWRQYFIRVAQGNAGEKFESKVSENMTAEQVAEYLQLDIKTIRNWTSENKIPFVKLGRAVRYPKTRIDNWLKTKEKKVVRYKVSK